MPACSRPRDSHAAGGPSLCASERCCSRLHAQGDNDPVDVVEIGGVPLESGGVYPVKVLGAYAMIDCDELDWKLVCIRADHERAPVLHDIADVERCALQACVAALLWSSLRPCMSSLLCQSIHVHERPLHCHWGGNFCEASAMHVRPAWSDFCAWWPALANACMGLKHAGGWVQWVHGELHATSAL